MKTIIERGASWTLEETKLLLSLWGQDLVQRQATCLKRTKEVYEKISEKFNQSGFERTPDQVRTRVFNMIAEYRRILRDPNPERMKKCIFFEALHKIYQAKHMDDVKSALDDYEPENPYSPSSNTILSERGDESISDSEVLDDMLINATATSNSANANNNSSNSNDAASASANNNATNSSTTTNSTKNNNTSASSDNIRDSINKNNDNNAMLNNKDNVTDRDALSSNHQSSAKKIKLESPKPGTSQGQTASPLESGSKQKITSQNVAGPSSSCTSSTSNNATSSTNNVSGVKHQSLLLPNATSASSSTPNSKLTTSGSNSSASYININSTKLPIIRTNQFIGHSNGNDTININGTPTSTRLPTTAAISHQLYQAPVNTFDVTSSALLIDRMFAHLSRESENMREWIALEKERIALERTRRAQETERELRRERVLIDTLMKFHEQWISFITRLDPRLIENASGQIPELNIPPREGQAPEQGTAAPQPNSSSSSNATNTNTSAKEKPKLFKASGGSSAPSSPQHR